MPFLLESSHLASKIKNSSWNEVIEYLDWCWELSPQAFIAFLIEVLETGDLTLKEESISWIAEALKLDDRV